MKDEGEKRWLVEKGVFLKRNIAFDLTLKRGVEAKRLESEEEF